MNYTVYRDNSPVKVSESTVFPSPYNSVKKAEYAQFMLKDAAELHILSTEPVESVIIRPLSLKLEASHQGNEIIVRVERPMKFSVEINGSSDNNLMVFAEPPRYEGFEPQTKNLVRFGPGVHKVDILRIEQDDTTLYLEEGAFLHGKIDLEGVNRVTVCGYGAISMEQYPLEVRKTYNRCVDVRSCADVRIQDITILDSNDWSLRVLGCDRVCVDNVKIFGCRGNSDGVDICGSRDVLVQNVFTRVWDDSLVVKAFDTGDVENILFRDCVLWNDFARPIELGVELRADRVSNVRFENIDILHSPTGYPLMGIHHGDRAEISHITFENIRIENAPGAQLFDIRMAHSYWNRDTKMGRIRDILFKDISYIGNPGIDVLLSQSRIQGFSEQHDIRNVTFENIKILGRSVSGAAQCGLLCMDYADNIIFKGEKEGQTLELIKTDLSMEEEFVRRPDGYYAGKVKISLHNTGIHPQETSVRLQISPANVGRYDRGERNLSLQPGETVTLTFDVVLPPGKYVLAVQSKDCAVSYSWIFRPLDWVIPEILYAGEEDSVSGLSDEMLEGLPDEKEISWTDAGSQNGYFADSQNRRYDGSQSGYFADLQNGYFEGSPDRDFEASPDELRDRFQGNCASPAPDLFRRLDNAWSTLQELEFINYYNKKAPGVKAAVCRDRLYLWSQLLTSPENSFTVYSALPVPPGEGEAVFSVEETDFGMVPALLRGPHGLEAAPQLRCPLEITLVFKAEPKVKEIRQNVIHGGGSAVVSLSFEELGLPAGVRRFWLEIQADLPEVSAYRYPFTLFHSVTPETTAHMFADVVVEGQRI